MCINWENLWQLIPTALDLKQKAKKQRQFSNSFLPAILSDVLKTNDGTLQKKDLRRMYDYPLQFIVFFAEQFATLRQKPLTEMERKKITLYAAAGCLYDDFFDENALNHSRLWQLFENPHNFVSENTKEKTCALLMRHLYQQLEARKEIDTIFTIFFQAQIQSQNQILNPNINFSEIQKISFQKGGFALLLSRFLMDEIPSEKEASCVFQIGAWYQVLDDILDLEKDKKAQIRTLATASESLEDLEVLLATQTKLTFQAIQALDYPTKLKNKIIFQFFMIGTSGKVYLYQLKKINANTNPLESPKTSVWIENRWSNWWIAVRFLLQDLP